MSAYFESKAHRSHLMLAHVSPAPTIVTTPHLEWGCALSWALTAFASGAAKADQGSQRALRLPLAHLRTMPAVAGSVLALALSRFRLQVF